MKIQPFRTATVQASPVFLDLDGGIAKAIRLIDEAGAAGARLIAFPETWLPGYPWWIWIGTPAWAMAKGFVRRNFENALSYDSPQATVLQEAAARNDIIVVMGLTERDGGSLYMAQWLIAASGETIARRRKLKPTHVERTVFGEGDGSDLAVHETTLGRLGALCCWEHFQPLSKYAMYSQNEQLHVAAWPSFSLYEPFAPALGATVNNAASRIYAVEGSCFVLGPSGVVSQEMFDLLCDTDDKRELLRVGGGYAVGYGPDGSSLFDQMPHDQEGLLYADIDLGAISVAKAAADPAGHYSRPDVTRLLFNRQRARPVEHFVSPLHRAAKPTVASIGDESSRRD